MTIEELKYIKDAFSQIIDDIAGNPDWYEAARAVASDLGTLERELGKKVASLPSNLDEAAEKYATYDSSNLFPGLNGTPLGEESRWKQTLIKTFKAGAEWMAGQGETKRGVATQSHYFIQFADGTYIDLDPTMRLIPAFKIKDAEEIYVQIRKKQ